MPVKFDDHSAEIKAQLARNIKTALTALGQKGVELTLDKMQIGYGRPIRQTGNLMRDVSFAVENSGQNSVDVGNSLEYAPFVHDGTYKMAGRPYLRDALIGGEKELTGIAKEYLNDGF